MKRVPRSLFLSSIAAGLALTCASTSQAGPWLDSILGRKPPAYPVGSPIPVAGQTPYAAGYSAYPAWNAGYVPSSYAPNAGSLATGVGFPMTTAGYGAYPGYVAPGYGAPSYGAPSYAAPVATLPVTSGFGSYGSVTPPTTNAPLLPPGFPQSVAGVLPTAAYDTQWGRTPVTYYRPVTAFDPRYGTTVTSLQPCTSYQYQAQRVPTIAPRPILGEYGYQANKWPSITGPGYNPTGLAATNPFPSYQGMPSSGFPMNGVASTFAPVANSGNSFGMPASSLPATTMSYQPPTSPTTTANYLGSSTASNVWGNASPYASTWAPYNSNSVIPSAAYSSTMPGTTSALPTYGMPPSASCANGTCQTAGPYSSVPGSTNFGSTVPGSMNPGSVMPNNMINPGAGASPSGTPYVPPPNIPGATVTPMGQPTYSNTPLPAPQPSGGFNPGMIPQQPPVMPNQQVLPNQPTPGTGLGDPDAIRVPGGSQASISVPSTPQEVQRLPMVAIDRGNSNATSSMSVGSAPSIPSTLNDAPSSSRKAAEEPASNWQFSGVQPLTAPENFDSKPKWNPTLLDPEDRTVMERSGQLMRPRDEKNGKIELRDEDSSVISTIAIKGKNEESNRIQLVSGNEPRKNDSKETMLPGFRPRKPAK